MFCASSTRGRTMWGQSHAGPYGCHTGGDIVRLMCDYNTDNADRHGEDMLIGFVRSNDRFVQTFPFAAFLVS